MRGPVGPLSKFRNRSLLVALSGGLKSCELFQRFCTSLAPRPKPAQKYKLFHGKIVCIQPGPAPPRRYPAELMAFTARGQPEIRQIGRSLGRRPAGVRHNLLGLGLTSVLRMYTIGALFECDCHRELSQIQASSVNSLKLNSTNSAGPLS